MGNESSVDTLNDVNFRAQPASANPGHRPPARLARIGEAPPRRG